MGPEENNDGKRILSFWCPFFHRSFLLIFSGLNHFPNKRGSKPSSSTLPSHRAWKAQILLRLSSIEAANDQDDATLQVRQGLVVWSGCFVLLLGGVFFHFEKKDINGFYLEFPQVVLGDMFLTFTSFQLLSDSVVSFGAWVSPTNFLSLVCSAGFLSSRRIQKGRTFLGNIYNPVSWHEWMKRKTTQISATTSPKKRRHVFSPATIPNNTSTCRSEVVFWSYSSNKTVDIF